LQENLDQRIIGDYEIGFNAELNDANIAIENATEIISGLKNYLSTKL